jgi:hypothetical protein
MTDHLKATAQSRERVRLDQGKQGSQTASTKNWRTQWSTSKLRIAGRRDMIVAGLPSSIQETPSYTRLTSQKDATVFPMSLQHPCK